MGLSQRKEQRKVLYKMSPSEPKSIGQAIIDGDLKFKPWLTKFSPELFEVSFSNIIKGRGHEMYLDPEKFYENTQMTKRMKYVLQLSLTRTAGLDEKGTIYLATSFGGGKSHLLTLLYHTFKSKKMIDPQYLVEVNLDLVPDVEVVAIDGHNLTYPIREDKALGKYIKETMDEILKALNDAGRPVIFLIDEFVVYLAKQNDTVERNEMANLHTLMMAVNASSNCLMVVTNPSGSKVYGKETETLDAHIRKSRHTETTQNVSSLLSRVTEPIVPVEKNDFVSILRKRLVDSFDQETAEAVEKYLESKFAGMVFKDFYPFHPLLIDVLYDRVSLFPDFQKTRDALKIIALAIKGIITHKESAKFHVISPADLFFDDSSLRGILTNENVFGTNLEQAVTQDVVDNAMEADNGEVFGLYGRMASAVFMYSLHTEPSKQGVSPGTVFKCITDAQTEKDVEAMLYGFYEKFSTFMWLESSRYLFKAKQNVPHLVKIRENRVSPTLIKNYIQKTLYSTVFDRANDVHCSFFKPLDFVPTPNRLNIIVPFYWDNVAEIVKTRLSITAPYKNTVLVLMPDRTIAVTVEGFARRVIAAKQVQKEVLSDKTQAAEAKRITVDAEAKALTQFKGTYTQLNYLKGNTARPVAIDLTRAEVLGDAIINKCKENQKVVDMEQIDPKGYLETLLGVRVELQVRKFFPDVETRTDIPFASRNQMRAIIGQGVYEGVIELLKGSLPSDDDFTGRETFHPRVEGIPVNDGDTVLSIDFAKTVRALIEKAKTDVPEPPKGPDQPDGPKPPLPPPVDPPIEQPEEQEVFVADAADVHRMLSDRWFDILLDDTISVRVSLQFSGSITGTLTANSRSEVSAILNLTDGVSKASEILGGVKITATIYTSKTADT